MTRPDRHLLNALAPDMWAADQLGFAPDPWQQRVLRSTAPRVAVNVSRQLGKSSTAAVLALHTAVHRPDSLTLLLAPSLRQSGELFRKVDALASKLGIERTEDSASTLQLRNGARVVCVPATEATSRGFSAPKLIIVDEAARVHDDVLTAVRPMLAHGGRLLMLSTPAGQRGAFFEACRGEQCRDWETHEVPATAVQRIPTEFLESERRAMGPRRFQQEYLCSFEATDAALFDVEQLERCLDDSVVPLFSFGGTVQRHNVRSVLSVVPALGVRQ